MRRSLKLSLIAVAAVVAVPVLAGGPECEKAAKAAKTANAAYAKSDKPCTMSAADCKAEMAAARTRGWVGLQLDHTDSDEMVVTKVVADSPAQSAGFEVGDVLVGVNGIGFTKENHDKLAEAKKGFKPGVPVTYTVRRDGSERKLAVTLGKMPDSVYTAWVEEHMKEHAELTATR